MKNKNKLLERKVSISFRLFCIFIRPLAAALGPHASKKVLGLFRHLLPSRNRESPRVVAQVEGPFVFLGATDQISQGAILERFAASLSSTYDDREEARRRNSTSAAEII